MRALSSEEKRDFDYALDESQTRIFCQRASPTRLRDKLPFVGILLRRRPVMIEFLCASQLFRAVDPNIAKLKWKVSAFLIDETCLRDREECLGCPTFRRTSEANEKNINVPH